MLGNWPAHDEYHKFVVEKFSLLAQVNPSALFEYEKELSKLYILNLDDLKTFINQ